METRIGGFGKGVVLFSGTIGTIAGLVVGDSYEFQMTDPVLNRTIWHQYDCEILSGAIEDY